MIKSVLPRIGGKTNLGDFILKKTPPCELFVEVFCGSCVISLNQPKAKTIVVNDADKHLISFWGILQNPKKRTNLITLLDGTLYSRLHWQEARERWKSGDIPVDEIQRAAAWYFLNRASYASDCQSGGFASAMDGRNICASFRNSILRFNKIGEIMRGWIVECLDFRACISHFDSNSTCFFVDAPYYIPVKRDYYQNRFGMDDHRKLAEILNNVKGKVLFCHYENEDISRLYNGWNCFRYESFKGASNNESKPKTAENSLL